MSALPRKGGSLVSLCGSVRNDLPEFLPRHLDAYDDDIPVLAEGCEVAFNRLCVKRGGDLFIGQTVCSWPDSDGHAAVARSCS